MKDKVKLNKLKLLLSKHKFEEIVIVVFVFTLGIFLVPRAFAEPIKNVELVSSDNGFEDKDPGAWKVNKSVKWIAKGKGRITFNLDTALKTNYNASDIIFVLDTSESMYGDKLDRVKKNATALIDSLLTNSNNQAALVTFNSTSNIKSYLTDNKDSLISLINNLGLYGQTNYYQALVNVNDILNNYDKVDKRECIVLFLTDGYPNVETPNENWYFDYLKQQYPFVKFHGIQYEMGDTILEPLKKISDKQFIADIDTLNNVLFEASAAPVDFDNISIDDFIDTEYFYVENEKDIKVDNGEVSFDSSNQKINWSLNNFRSSSSASMTIDVKLKDEFIGSGGVYPTNKRVRVISKIDNINEDVETSNTPFLFDNYRVMYDVNTPKGCSVIDVPSTRYQSVFETVKISNKKLTCDSYLFKGWEIVTDDVKRVNDDYFIMPENDVVIRAKWSSLKISKSVDGEMNVRKTLYNIIAEDSVLDDRRSQYVHSNYGINFSNISSFSNGKGIYEFASTKDDKFPVYYYRGAVDNNNLKFAGFCWKIVRTTSTGGVKLVYSGAPNDKGECVATDANDLVIGTGKFSNNKASLSSIGYMQGSNLSDRSYFYPTWYELIERQVNEREFNYFVKSILVSRNYFYSDSISWNGSSYEMFNSDGSDLQQVIWAEGHNDLSKKYVCLNSGKSSCSTIYFVFSTNTDSAYVLPLTNGNLKESVDNWEFSKEVVYDNGVYTLINSKTSAQLDWYSGKYSSLSGYYSCPNGSSTCSNISYLLSPSSISSNYNSRVKFKTISMSDGETYDNLYQQAQNIKWIYANDVEWDGSKYILKDLFESSPLDYKTEKDVIGSKFHYTCFSTEQSCINAKYIYYINYNYPNYFSLNGGKTIDDVINDAFANINDSNMKSVIDYWYENNIGDEYRTKIEDTIWCNDRSTDGMSVLSKDGNASNYLYFAPYIRLSSSNRPSLVCENVNDRFTVSKRNGNGMLKYPVALLTSDEANMSGAVDSLEYSDYSYSFYLKLNMDWYTMSPGQFTTYGASVNIVRDIGVISEHDSVTAVGGIRPAISLMPGIYLESGNGTSTDPYVIDMDS